MPHISVVLYPNSPDATFDMKYYIETHMPLVEEQWNSHGLEKWQVVQYDGTDDAQRTPYAVHAVLTWRDEAAVKAAIASPGAKIVFDDVPNFSNQRPIFMSGGVIKQT
jgi:uncharacterized protein (TIGR02118 family)